jgi:hypothetical protein
MCVGCVEWKKSETIQKLRVLPTLTVGQSQTLFLSMVEDYELQFSLKLS